MTPCHAVKWLLMKTRCSCGNATKKKLNMQCSKGISKDVRPIRNESTTQEPRHAPKITRLLFEILLLRHRRTRLERKIDEKSFETRRKSIPDRPKIDEKINLEPFWAPKAVSGTRQDALGTAFGHPNAGPKPILGSPRRAKSGQEPSKSLPRPPRRRSKTLPVGRPSAWGAPSGFERVFGSIFGRFRLVERKLRCASRTSFYNVFWGSHEIRTERA